ncbi:MAG: GTPase [Planctomycetota bacterium]
MDTRTKRWTPSHGASVLLSDTVGFVKNLPHHLVASFKATLEEAVNADILLHIIDVSNAEVTRQIESVNEVLDEINCGKKPTLKVFNKVDIVKNIGSLEMLQTMYPDAMCISAKTGFGMDALGEAVAEKYRGNELMVHVESSQANGRVQVFLRANGTIIKEQYLDGSVLIDARLGQNQLAELKRLRPKKLTIES